MARSFHQTNIIGNIGRDPEIVTFGDDGKLVKFSVAVNENFGEKQETIWYNLVAFGRLAEIIAQLCKAGSHVHLLCTYNPRSWVTEEGETRYSNEFKVQTFNLLGNGRQGAKNDEPAATDDFPF